MVSYKMATNYYPDLRLENEGRSMATYNRSIDGNEQYLIERRKRENIPTSPNEDLSYTERVDRSELGASAVSRRRSGRAGDVSQHDVSKVGADRSLSINGNVQGGYS